MRVLVLLAALALAAATAARAFDPLAAMDDATMSGAESSSSSSTDDDAPQWITDADKADEDPLARSRVVAPVVPPRAAGRAGGVSKDRPRVQIARLAGRRPAAGAARGRHGRGGARAAPQRRGQRLLQQQPQQQQQQQRRHHGRQAPVWQAALRSSRKSGVKAHKKAVAADHAQIKAEKHAERVENAQFARAARHINNEIVRAHTERERKHLGARADDLTTHHRHVITTLQHELSEAEHRLDADVGHVRRPLSAAQRAARAAAARDAAERDAYAAALKREGERHASVLASLAARIERATERATGKSNTAHLKSVQAAAAVDERREQQRHNRTVARLQHQLSPESLAAMRNASGHAEPAGHVGVKHGHRSAAAAAAAAAGDDAHLSKSAKRKRAHAKHVAEQRAKASAKAKARVAKRAGDEKTLVDKLHAKEAKLEHEEKALEQRHAAAVKKRKAKGTDRGAVGAKAVKHAEHDYQHQLGGLKHKLDALHKQEAEAASAFKTYVSKHSANGTATPAKAANKKSSSHAPTAGKKTASSSHHAPAAPAAAATAATATNAAATAAAAAATTSTAAAAAGGESMQALQVEANRISAYIDSLRVKLSNLEQQQPAAAASVSSLRKRFVFIDNDGARSNLLKKAKREEKAKQTSSSKQTSAKQKKQQQR